MQTSRMRSPQRPVERTILELQKTAGNEAVTALIQRAATASAAFGWLVQREPAGKPAGVMTPILLEGLASGGNRKLDAVALVPPSVAGSSGPVQILLHMHGVSIYEGHKYENMLRKSVVPPEFDMPAQLGGYVSTTPGGRMIALLPIGKTVQGMTTEGKGPTKKIKKYWNVDFGGFDADTLAGDAIKRLVADEQLKAGSTPGSIVLSAHSGGGLGGRSVAASKNVRAMFAFESIHGDIGGYKALLAGKLANDLAQLKSLAADEKADLTVKENAFKAQQQYIREKAFHFVGYAGSNKGYVARYTELRESVLGSGGWMQSHAAEFGQAGGAHAAELRQLLEANYQFNIDEQAKGNHFALMDHGHLEQALKSLGGSSAVAPAATGSAATPVKGPAPAPSRPKAARAQAKTAGAGTAAAGTAVSITFGPNAKRDAVAESSIEIIKDILRTAGLTKATISSTARNADDQARAMYHNLVNVGVAAQRKLYGPYGRKVIDTFETLRDEGKNEEEIRDGMRDRILELGPSKVSRHCGDFRVLNVVDIDPGSLGGKKARDAFSDAAQAAVGKTISNFIPWPKDPGEHLEIKPTSGGAPPTKASSSPSPVATPVPVEAPKPNGEVLPQKGRVTDQPAVTRPKKTSDKKKPAAVDVAGQYILSDAERAKLPELRANQQKLKTIQTEIDQLSRGKLSEEKRARLEELKKEKKQLQPAYQDVAAMAKQDIEKDILAIKPAKSVKEWFDEIDTSATFLGQPIGPNKGSTPGVHREMLERLQAAEKLLEAEAAPGTPGLGADGAKKLGQRISLGGLRPAEMATGGSVPSMHCYGLAVDINYSGNPFLGFHTAQRGKKTVRPAAELVKHATQLINGSPFDIMAEPGKRNAMAMWDALNSASEAVKTYLNIKDDIHPTESLTARVAVNGGGHDLDWWRNALAEDRQAAKEGDFMAGKKVRDAFTKGIMDLPKVLVQALDAVGLSWGARYGGAKDIMHFDYRRGSIKGRAIV